MMAGSGHGIESWCRGCLGWDCIHLCRGVRGTSTSPARSSMPIQRAPTDRWSTREGRAYHRNKYSVNWEQKRMDEMKTLLTKVCSLYHDQEKVKNGDD